MGFAICCRLIDEFLLTRPQTQTLRLLFSTRDTRKSEDTLKRLNAHLQKTLREANGRTLGISLLLEARVKLEGVLVDMTKLLTVKALAEDLLTRGQRLDAVVWNAGLAGWSGLDYPTAIWQMVTDLVHACTYPTYPRAQVGLVADRQLGPAPSGDGKRATGDEPKLGQIFLSNVFGHYMLTHWLSPLLPPSSRVIWIGSVSAVPDSFDTNDVQCLRSPMPYEGSKRLTDYLVLTSELASTRPYVSSFFHTGQQQQRPRMYLTHPGVAGTSISGLNWLLKFFMFAVFYLARFLGSPWHPIQPYKGAISAVFAALAPFSQLPDQEEREGKGKWGSATGRSGDERVARTETEGWGFCGRVGVVPPGSVTGIVGRYHGHRQTTQEMREQFEDDGWKVWRDMEELRVQWESRLGPVSVADSADVERGSRQLCNLRGQTTAYVVCS